MRKKIALMCGVLVIAMAIAVAIFWPARFHPVSNLSSLAQVILSVYVINPNVPEPTPAPSGSGGGGGGSAGGSGSSGSIASTKSTITPVTDPGTATAAAGKDVTRVDQSTSAAAPVTIAIAQRVFTQTLAVGATGSDVTLLQRFLNTHGFAVATKGVGSIGKESKKFGPKTHAALKNFQIAHYQEIFGKSMKTFPQGNFGPLTKAYILKLLTKEAIAQR